MTVGAGAPRSGTRRSPGVLGWSVLLYLAVLPLAQLVRVQAYGAVASLSDILLLGVLGVGVLELFRALTTQEEVEVPVPEGRDARRGLFLLACFGIWVAVSGRWGFHPVYAFMKGAGVVALAGGAWLIASSRLSPTRLAEAWLLGAGVTVVGTLVVALAVPGAPWVVYDAGLVSGLPVPRLKGPFGHPNVFGEYLAVSGALLWAIWPRLHGRRPAVAVGFAAALAAAFLLSVSTGWIAAGVVLLGVSLARRWAGRVERVVAGAMGFGLVAGTLWGLIQPATIDLGAVEVRSGGVRPAIWADAAAAVAQAPVVGVGAAPFLAETADPLSPGTGTALWDAHSAYLSVLGQFGVLGGVLFFGGVGLVVWGEQGGASGRVGEHDRLRYALLLAALGVMAHWTVIAGEDARHVWALWGLVGAMGASTDEASPGGPIRSDGPDRSEP